MSHPRSRSAATVLATTGLVVITVMASTPSILPAQETGSASLDPRLGVALPLGGLNDVTDPGVTAGLGFAAPIHPRVAIRGDLQYSRLTGATDDLGNELAPSLDLFTISAGVEYDFPRPRWQDVPLSFQLALGVGITDMSGSMERRDGGLVEFDQTYPTVTGGARIGLAVTDRIRGFVRSEALLVFADEGETAVLTQRAPGVDPMSTVWTIPLTAGVQITVN